MDGLSNARAAVHNAIPAGQRPKAAFELKGLSTSLTVLRLRSADLALLERQLRIKVMQFPQFFQDAPVLLDLSTLEGGVAGLSLPMLVRVLRACRVVPVAVANAPDELREAALAAGLGILPQTARAREPRASDDGAPELEVADRGSGPVIDPVAPSRSRAAEADAPTHVVPPTPSAARVVVRPKLPVVVRQPVRSGQVVYAEQSDLIVLAPVNPGAQLVADGNIHVYAPLRGRALAGAHGFPEARIFCQKLEAELVSIGDAYLTADDVPEARWGKPTQIFLESGECRLLAL